MKNNIYLVVSSSGDYDDFQTVNEKAFLDPEDADKYKDFLDKKFREVPPFPFDWDEENVYSLYDDGFITEKEFKIYDNWCEQRSISENHRGCWVEKIELVNYEKQ